VTAPPPRTATSRPRLRGSPPITVGPPGPDPRRRRAPRPRPIPFLAHQLLEYLVAGSLAGLSIHIRHSGLLLAAAAAFALLAVTARAPLGLAKVCGPRLHATLDVVVAVAVAAAPILPALRPDITGIAAVEVTALAWLRLSTLTRYTRLPSPSGGGTLDGDGVPVGNNTVGNNTVGIDTVGDRTGSPATGAVVLRGLGILAGRSARRLPEAEEKLHGGARQAGRHAARLQRTWRKPPT
jgi:hypothetical protein